MEESGCDPTCLAIRMELTTWLPRNQKPTVALHDLLVWRLLRKQEVLLFSDFQWLWPQKKPSGHLGHFWRRWIRSLTHFWRVSHREPKVTQASL